MSIFIPFLYIFLSYILGRFSDNLSKYASFILINILIPVVVFTTIMTYKGAIFQIVLGSFLFSVLMYYLAKKLYDSVILQIGFSYYNIGWLGLPIAIYFFGQEVSPLIIAAYIGGMLFGSTFCIYVLNETSKNKNISPVKKLLYSPPFLAFLFGVILKLTLGTISLNETISSFYLIIKTIMSIFGMAILGMWMQKSSVKKEHWKEYLGFSIQRLIVGIAVFGLFFGIMVYFDIISKSELLSLLIIPLLPVAANIVVLETYYLKQAQSAQVISINTIFSLGVLILFGSVIQYV